MFERKNRSGAMSLEYALIASLMAVVIMGALIGTSEVTGIMFEQTATALTDAMSAAMG